MTDEFDEQAADQEAVEETKRAIQRSANVAKAGWKDGLRFGKTSPMPKSDWKKSLINLPGMPDKKPASKKKR